ncbi:MAG: TetR/AcrR family transcriptional regulator [Solirubrobacteraceae bacterium]
MTAPNPDHPLIWTRPERPRTRREPLTRERIVRAAIELADERGLEGLSTRAIAARLGSGPTSMYWHVPTQADLYELIVDQAIGEVPLLDSPSGDWRADMRHLAHGALAMFTRHPWLSLLGIQPGIGPHSRRYGEFAVDVMIAAGVDDDTAIQATAIINNYVIGFAQRRAAWRQLKDRVGPNQDLDARLNQYLAELEVSDPSLAEHFRTRSRLTDDANFNLGLDCVLEGIATQLLTPHSRFIH